MGGFIINEVIVKDEENANYYPARRYHIGSLELTFIASSEKTPSTGSISHSGSDLRKILSILI